MTYAELKQEVIHLGLLDGLDDEALEHSFSYAADRAIRETAALIPRIRRTVIAHYPLRPMRTESFTHSRDDITVHCADAAAFCLYLSGGGVGSITVTGTDAERTVEVNGAARTLIRYTVSELLGKERDELTLTFSGGYYRVTELSFFGAAVADMLPPCDGTAYDMRAQVSDFLRFASKPIGDGLPVSEDYVIDGSALILSAAVPDGDYSVYYEHRPEPVNPDDSEAELDVEREIDFLVPLLAAYYIWMEDQPDKAAQFYQRYTEQIGMLRNHTRHIGTHKEYRSVNGWD